MTASSESTGGRGQAGDEDSSGHGETGDEDSSAGVGDDEVT